MFARRLGIFSSGVQARSVSTLDYSREEPQTQVTSQAENTRPGILRRVLNHPFVKPRSGLDLFKRLSRGVVLGLTTFFTIPLAFGVNETLAHLKIVPRPVKSSSSSADTLIHSNNFISDLEDNGEQANPPPSRNIITTIIDSLINGSSSQPSLGSVFFDNFVLNCQGSEVIGNAIRQGKIDPNTLDTNNSGVIFDNVGDFEELKSKLKTLASNPKERNNKQLYEDAYAKLHEIEGLHCYLWGHEGPDPDKIVQTNGGECSTVADVIGACLTPKNIQRLLKQNLQVTDYNLSEDKEEFFINMKITINGQMVRVHYGDLKIWTKYDCRDAPIGPCAFIYAIEKELEQDYVPTPYAPLSAPSTLLTGEKYYIIPTILLSDDDLREIFSQAPNTLIKLGSYPRADTYVGNWVRYLNLRAGSNPSEGKFVGSEVYETHAYIVKGTKIKNGEYKVIVKDSEPEKELSMSQIRDTMIYVDLPKNKARMFNNRTLTLIALALILSYGLTRGINGIEEKRKKRQALANLEPVTNPT